jgi:tRNA modification GTPase
VKDITSALALESQGVPLDIVSSVLQEGLSALGEITGAVTSAEILETIFSGFCVGK